MSKNETELILQRLTYIIQSLSNQQFQMILTGRATLKYEELDVINNEYDSLKSQIQETVKDMEEFQHILNNKLKTKPKLLDFCQYLKISAKQKDTKQTIINKLANYFHVVIQSEITDHKIESIELQKEFKEISETLRSFIKMEEAKTFINNHPLFQRKNNLFLFAKSIDMHAKNNMNKTELIDRIVESLIGSKIRLMVIRGEVPK